MTSDAAPIGFLAPAVHSAAAQARYDKDVEEAGFVMNVSRLWAYAPAMLEDLFELLGAATVLGSLSFRQRAVLVTATASTIGDSYCSIAWGDKLASVTDERTAVGVITGDDRALASEERALACWARRIAGNPSGVVAADIDELRAAGFSDQQIFGITAYVALRIAFSTVNGALGAVPDAELRSTVPAALLDAITYGRPPAPLGSTGNPP